MTCFDMSQKVLQIKVVATVNLCSPETKALVRQPSIFCYLLSSYECRDVLGKQFQAEILFDLMPHSDAQHQPGLPR